MEIGKRVLLLSENETEAKRTQRTLQNWGWDHVIVCASYRDIVRHLKSNPFGYAMVVIEKIYDPALEDRFLRAIKEAHQQIPIVIRSKVRASGYEQLGRVTYLADTADFDALVDVMERIYRDESMGHESAMPASLWKRKPKATAGPKVVPFKAGRKPSPPDRA